MNLIADTAVKAPADRALQMSRSALRWSRVVPTAPGSAPPAPRGKQSPRCARIPVGAVCESRSVMAVTILDQWAIAALGCRQTLRSFAANDSRPDFLKYKSERGFFEGTAGRSAQAARVQRQPGMAMEGRAATPEDEPPGAGAPGPGVGLLRSGPIGRPVAGWRCGSCRATAPRPSPPQTLPDHPGADRLDRGRRAGAPRR